EEVVSRTLARYPQPEMGYRPVLGILRVAEKHGATAMDAACQRALSVAGRSAPHRRHIEGILKRGLERAISLAPVVTPNVAAHECVRGGSYFDMKEDNDTRRNDTEAHQPYTQHFRQRSARDDGDASR